MRVELGDIPAGLADIAQAVEIFEKTSPDSMDLAVAQCRHAWALSRGGEATEAAQGFTRAFAQFDRSLKDDAHGHPEVQTCQSLQKEIQ